LQLRGVRPFLSDKFDITKHKNYKYLSDFDKRNAFDVGKYVSTRLKVNPNEDFIFFEHIPAEEEMPDEAFGDFQPVHEPDSTDLEPV
jgi:type IV secretion system protein VirD4